MSARDRAADDAAALLDLIESKWITQAIGVAAELGIPDLIASGTNAPLALARATGCHAPSLDRLLRALLTLGLCREDPPGRYALTATGEHLRSDAPITLRAWARWGARHHWHPWGQLLESVRSGQSARARAGEAGGYSQMEADADKAAVFNQAMVEVTSLVAAAVAEAHDFSSARRVVDVGGGYGELLWALLSRHAHLRGVLFDLPHAVAGARERVARSGLEPRCELVAGSFFEGVPASGDAYLMKSIVHNWDDERARQVLRACRGAMPAHARVLLVERVMPERLRCGDHERRVVRADLNMLVSHAGRERTREEFESLLRDSGLALARVEPLAVGFSLLEAAPA